VPETPNPNTETCLVPTLGPLPPVGSHGTMGHYCWWNKYVANPIKAHGYAGKGRDAMRVLKQEILSRVLLRRTKVQCADVLALPPRCGAEGRTDRRLRCRGGAGLRDGQTDRWTDRQTIALPPRCGAEGPTDRQMDRRTDRQTIALPLRCGAGWAVVLVLATGWSLSVTFGSP
jgi:hypothetical protein